VLDRAVLCHLAVPTPHGPHVTPAVFVLDGGRVWVTTSRSSVKARSWRADPSVAGLAEGEGLVVAFRGRARLYDALDPRSWVEAALSGPAVPRAAVRFAAKNARFFLGYALDAARLPPAWAPPGRVLVGIDLLAGRVVRAGDGAEVARWGEWTEGAAYRRSFAPARRPPGRAPDRRAPRSVREAVGTGGRGVVAVQGPAGPAVLPAGWRRNVAEGTFEAALPRALFELSGAGAAGPAALAASRLSPWRASGMRGLLVQGRGEAFAPGPTVRGVRALRSRLASLAPLLGGDTGPRGGQGLVLLRLRPHRVVWWEGWASGSAGRGRPGRRRP
jgi:hypothetical protein